MQGPILDAKLAAMGLNGLASLVRQSDSGESCIVLQRGPTRNLVAKFPQRSVVACST